MINILTNRYMIDSDWCFEDFKRYIKKDNRVAIIPFSFRDELISSKESWSVYYDRDLGLFYNGVVDSFLRYGIHPENVKWINYFEDSVEISKKIVSESDILYFPGGLPDKMLSRLHEFELVDLIENHTGVVLGYSAGAVIQFKRFHLTPDRDYPNFGYHIGMNIIDNFSIEVHYTNTDLQNESIKKVLCDTGKPVYAIEDDGALIVENGMITTVGKVHFFDVV